MSARDVLVPNIGEFSDLPVVEVLVAVGDAVDVGQSLVTIESDKATMEVPSPVAGTISEVVVAVGDTISEGSLLVRLEGGAEGEAAAPGEPEAVEPAAPEVPPAEPEPEPGPPAAPSPPPPSDRAGPARANPAVRASPGVRMLARELGVDLGTVSGSGPAGRLLKGDVEAFVRRELGREASPAAEPDVDLSRFGPVEVRPLSRLRRRAGANLHRSWTTIPHVTNHDEADVTELDAFRRQLTEERGADGPRVTLLAFLVKAAVATLQRFPEFNASLRGDELVLKRYHHIGFAADTEQGLVVPVIRDADRKGVLAIAADLAALAAKAREGALAPSDMEGGTFTISSLGGIGGTHFTPIVNAPEVAILGAGRARHQPVWDGTAFVPRLILPLSLSWDHRVVDGVAAARFNAHLASVLGDVRRMLL